MQLHENCDRIDDKGEKKRSKAYDWSYLAMGLWRVQSDGLHAEDVKGL